MEKPARCIIRASFSQKCMTCPDQEGEVEIYGLVDGVNMHLLPPEGQNQAASAKMPDFKAQPLMSFPQKL